MPTNETDKTLEVLRATVTTKDRPAGAFGVSPTGVRLVNMMRTIGWGGRKALTVGEVVQISAVLICLDVLAQDIAKTTFRMYERIPGGKRVVEPDEHPVAELLATEPNEWHTWYEFFEMVMLHLGMVQNAFIAKRMNGDRIEELIPCMPARTTILAVPPKNDKTGRGFYAYEVMRLSEHEKIQLGGLPDVFLPNEFIHLRGRMFDGLTGYSNLDAGARSFGLSKELVEYQTRLFANDGAMRGVFSHPDSLAAGATDKDMANLAFERLRDQLAELMHDVREHNRPIVLEEGMKFEQIAMSAEQAEVAKARDIAVVDVARTFRIPPHKIMHLINVKYENMETLEKSYVQDTLVPYATRIEQRMARSLLTKKERSRFYFEFDRQEMLLNDMEKVGEALKIQSEHGALTIDEMRQAFGRNPLPNKAGERTIVPSVYNLLDSKGVVIVAAGGQAPKDETTGEKDPKKLPAPKKDSSDDGHNVIPYPTVSGEK